MAQQRYPNNHSSPTFANSAPEMLGREDFPSAAASLTELRPPFNTHTAPATHSHQPPTSPLAPSGTPYEYQAGGGVFGGRRGQAFAGEGGGQGYYGQAQRIGYQQSHSWSRPARSSWVYPATPPPEADQRPRYTGNWYAPQYQYTAPQQGTWLPQYPQVLTQSHYSAAPPSQYQTPSFTPLNASATSFTPSVQQSVESVPPTSLPRSLGIDKAARYSQASAGPVPAFSIPGKKSKNRKSKREKKVEKATKLAQQAQTSIDLSAPAPNPQELDTDLQVVEVEGKASGKPIAGPKKKKEFNPRETKRKNVMQRPVPTPAYMYYAGQTAKTLDFSRPLLVILDLNGTLLFRKKFGGTNDFTARPHMHQFLQYLFSNHTVMVWSSSKPENVAKMCSDLFTPEQHSQLAAIWGRDKLNIPAHAYNQKVQVYKQLSWVWNDSFIRSNNPIPGGVWTQANTVLIDDSIEKAASEPHNIVELEEFEAKPEQMTTDVLGQVALYLDDLRSQRDVSAYMRMHPFVYNPEPPPKARGVEKRDTPMES